MLRNYLTVALRTIGTNPLFSFINVFGLAIGLACCIVITVFVSYELSYDQQWENKDRIYRVTRDFGSNDLQLAAVAPPIAPLLQEDFPDIVASTRIMRVGGQTLSRGDVSVREEALVVADKNVFDFYGLDFISGDIETALALPTNLVLSERAAQRYFGNENPMGQTLNLAGQMDGTVTGVFRDLPDNTHMAFEVVASIDVMPFLLGEDALTNWGSNNFYTYLLLPEGYDPDRLASNFDAFLVKHLGEDSASNTSLGLQPLTAIHLTSNRDAEWRSNGSESTVYTFGVVALVVLLIACVNFMNLTTARSTQRAREVGMRKAIGAQRSQIIRQFLGESILMTALAMLVALSMVELSLPAFGAFLEKELVLDLGNMQTVATLLVGTLLVGLIAGSYPAFYLSAFRPAAVLKGAASKGESGLLRRILVIFQFSTSIALLIATGIVMAQMHYARNMDMGFDRERNVIMGLPYFADLWETYDPLRTQLEAHPGIDSVVYSSRVPSMQNLDGGGYFPEGVQMDWDNMEGLADIKVDAHWFEHYNVTFLAGRAFRENEMRPPEPTAENPIVPAWAVVNESAARRFGWSPEEAIGKVLRQPTSRELDRFYDREIVGVIPDLHFSSLHDERKATVFAEPDSRYGRSISVKLAPGDPQAAIAHLEKTWGEIVPNSTLEWEFLDDAFDARYRSENRQANLFGLFSSLAIFVATLGLFGLASFTTEQRTKEIGIRKVMGASVTSIVVLLTRDFTRLVLLANLIAWPVAYYFMSEWLTRFVYRIDLMEWSWLFLAAAVAALVIAWGTIASQAGKAALSRPVQALRYE